MSCAFSTLVQLGLNLLRQDLSQLDTPLIEAVDVPYRTLGEGDMFVVRDQSSERAWRDLLGEDGGCGPITEECLVIDKLIGRSLSFDLCFRLAGHERFGLGKEVGCQHPGRVISTCPHIMLGALRAYF